jgi:hypothetical protein
MRDQGEVAEPHYSAQMGWCWSSKRFLANTTPAFGHPSSAEEGSSANHTCNLGTAWNLRSVWISNEPRFAIWTSLLGGRGTNLLAFPSPSGRSWPEGPDEGSDVTDSSESFWGNLSYGQALLQLS